MLIVKLPLPTPEAGLTVMKLRFELTDQLTPGAVITCTVCGPVTVLPLLVAPNQTSMRSSAMVGKT